MRDIVVDIDESIRPELIEDDSVIDLESNGCADIASVSSDSHGTILTDLVHKCKACEKPLGNFVMNIDGFWVSCALFLLHLTPIIARFVFKTTRLAHVSQAGTFNGKPMDKLGYALGFLSTFFILSSDTFEAARLIGSLFMGNSAKDTDKLSSEVANGGKGNEVKYVTLYNGNFVRWSTKVNVFKDNYAYSLFRWIKSATHTERLLHIVYNFRWLLSGTIIFSYILYLFILIFVDLTWTTHVHINLLHYLNGFCTPLVLYMWIKLAYNSIKLLVTSSSLYTKIRRPKKFTETGKIITKSPAYVFLKDKCPCRYAIGENNKLKKYYSYSTLFHTEFTFICKSYFLACAGTSVVLSVITSIYTIATKAYVG